MRRHMDTSVRELESSMDTPRLCPGYPQLQMKAGPQPCLLLASYSIPGFLQHPWLPTVRLATHTDLPGSGGLLALQP